MGGIVSSLKKFIKDNSSWLTVFDAFELIRAKTDLKLDLDIAELLNSIEINDHCIPYDRSSYDNGNPVRLHRDVYTTLSKMDHLLIDIASGSIVIDDSNLFLRNYVWIKGDFFFHFENLTQINLEGNDENEDNLNQNSFWDENYIDLQLKDSDLETFNFSDLNIDLTANEIDSLLEQWENTYNTSKSVPLYFKNLTFSVHEATCLMTGYNPISTSRFYNKTSWLEENPTYEEASDFIYSAVRSNFFEDFTNADPYITATKLKKFFNESRIYINGFNHHTEQKDDNPSIGHASINHYQQKNLELTKKIEYLENKLQQEIFQSSLLGSDYKSSQSEIENLKGTVSEQNSQIKKLKDDFFKENGSVFELTLDLNNAKKDIENLIAQNEQLKSNIPMHNKAKEENLLDTIFDKSQVNKYAPDLVSAIKLWEHLYINDTKNKDKHGNRANYWITKNTSYTNTTSIEVKRLREITSPFNDWHPDRKNKLISN